MRTRDRPALVAPIGRLALLALGVALVATGACTTPTGDGGGATVVWFQESAGEAGLDFHHRTGHQREHLMPEIAVGGVCLIDYDGDGRLDLYAVQSGALRSAPEERPGNVLYRNEGGGRFVDVTEAAGVGDRGYGMGCTVGDHDGDGDPDLYVTNVGRNVLLRNDGDGTFTDVTAEAGVGDASWGTSCAFLDHDADGDLDLFIVNYIRWSFDREIDCQGTGGEPEYCSPNNYQAPAPDVLYENIGGGRFRDVSANAGLHAAFGNGLGLVVADFDGDGRVDVYVANDGMPNQFWENAGGGRFIDRSLMLGCSVNADGESEAGMGVVAEDLDGDGSLDLFVTHLASESNTLYLRSGNWFDDATSATGLGTPSLVFTGFGVGAVDFDHDGHVDLFVANGRVKTVPGTHEGDDHYAEPNQLFRGLGSGRYLEVPAAGLGELLYGTSRGAAFGDLDNDGDIDVVVVNRDAGIHLLRNDIGDRSSSVTFRVLEASGALALAATVAIEAGGRRQSRTVQVASSYCASNDPRVHFGLGGATTLDRAVVRWVDGEEEEFGPLEGGREHVLRRGGGTRPPAAR